MSKREKLLEKARTGPASLSFDDLCALANQLGFVFLRSAGSHFIYRHPAHASSLMNFQNFKGKAKKFQVEQLLEFYDTHLKATVEAQTTKE
ncbi:MAG: type II toxin-antitoxin system HicA family toxin [Proteobacteria bacterium]|nr:type II toxin-antitoxin system HicA family toxin [Pseudomonadota bacterium]